jgi:hypothetical protein
MLKQQLDIGLLFLYITARCKMALRYSCFQKLSFNWRVLLCKMLSAVKAAGAFAVTLKRRGASPTFPMR